LTARRHYANAPITEALIDIRVDLSPDTKVESLDAFCDRVKADYPTHKNRFEATIQAQLSPVAGVAASGKQTKLGFLLRSTDEKQVVQVGVDGFTFSRLKPYEHWAALRDEAKRMWNIYREVAKPVRITRVAVRYINQIDVPLPMKEFKDYFRTVPEVSPELPQTLSGFFMQLQVPQKDLDSMLLLTQTLARPQAPKTVSWILDIDLFKKSTDFGFDEDVWKLLELFRIRKNEIFEGCITDNTRPLFGPIED
jgi:uncharacterized protein (TIGR04255 family)